MLVYMDWLKEYVDQEVDLDTYCERMIMSGSNIEAVDRYGDDVEKIVVGKIVSLEKHPDADKLLVCGLDVGQGEPLQIVTGAANVFVGAYVPVILDGGKLPDGTVIKKGKLRGMDSFGMLCSAKELGYNDKVIPMAHRDGIWIIDQEYPLGQPVVEALGLKGAVVDFEITPNRPDCLSMIGMARETAATFGGTLRYPDNQCIDEAGDASGHIRVEINKPELCRRYVARIVTDITIKPSPWWMQKRLMYAGVRPINNIVDVTNYVMLEYGQPTHAFDIRNLKGNRILVDTAFQGEVFTTLDGSDRTLTEDMLLIKDGERAVAIAGVMGGLNSEIVDDTATIVIESANFNGDSIRATSKRLGLRTEASSRFEKGIAPDLSEAAADRVCKLIEIIGGGKVVKGRVDVYPTPVNNKTVEVRVNRVNHVLGIEFSAREIEKIFVGLEMDVQIVGDVLKVTPPSVRQDLGTEIDLIEEIARIYGYDRLPTTLPKGNSESVKTRGQRLRDLAKDALVGMGASEIQTYSFVNPKGLDTIKLPADSGKREMVRLLNPLGEENSGMRTLLTPNMLEVLGRNYSRNIPQVKAFEIGNTFLKNSAGDDELPMEQESICIACYGAMESFFTLKGMVSELLLKMGIQDLSYVGDMTINTYHPGRCAKIYAKEIELGVIGELHPDVLELFGIGTKAVNCELDFSQAVQIADTERHYAPLPKYPSTSRDIALLVSEEITVGDLESIIRSKGTKLLESVALFDVYRGKQVPEGQKSVAFTLTYRATDRTLTDKDVIRVHDRVLAALKDERNVVLREM